MSSNAPPSDQETSSVPLNSPPLTSNNPHNVVVTQSQDRSPSQSRNLFSPNGQIDLLLQASEEIDHIVHQTPTILSSTISQVATPVIDSPTKAARDEALRTRLFSPSPSTKAASVAKRKLLLRRNSQTRRSYPNPQSSILWFLRHAKLSSTAENLKLPVDFSNKYRTVGNSFHSNPNISHKPFNDMKSDLINASNALTHRHSRLILEDIISLHPGEEVVCLIRRDHPFFQLKPFVSKLKKNLEKNPLKPVIINKKLFFAVRLQISSNPAGDEITSGMKSKEEVIKCVTDEVYGAGVNAQFEFTGAHLFKYQTFFDHGDKIQFCID